MSDARPSDRSRIREVSPAAEAVRVEVERLVPPAEAATVGSFAEAFLRRTPADLLTERDTHTLARMVLGAYRFLERSTRDDVDVEVLNPDEEVEGWSAPVTVIRTSVSERPFVVDTIREFVHSHDLSIERYIYPLLHVRREQGRLLEVRPAARGDQRESLVHCEVARIDDAGAREEIRVELGRRLRDVVRATDDFHAMVNAINDVIAELAERAREAPEEDREQSEIQAYLRWIRDGGFIFLGYRSYDLAADPETGGPVVVTEPGTGLGILRDEDDSRVTDPMLVARAGAAMHQRIEQGPELIIGKTNAESTVHRRARMDYIGVRRRDFSGRVVGEHRFVGLLTSHAYAEDAARIPILRLKLESILDWAGVQPGSHDFKEIHTIFNSMPKEELFLASAEQIASDIRTVLSSYNTDGVRVTLREDLSRQELSALVILPKDKFSGEVRRGIEGVLVEAFRGEVLNYDLALGSGDQARLHFYLTAAPGVLGTVAVSDLEASVRELIRSWLDRVTEAMNERCSRDVTRRLIGAYGEAFSPEYCAATHPVDAAEDLLLLDAMRSEGRGIAVAFANRRESVAAPGVENVTELKLYLRGQRLILSDFMPILENAGLRSIAVSPFEVEGRGVDPAILYVFAVQDQRERPLEVEVATRLLGDTILAVLAGDTENDMLNALVLDARLHWREVGVLRAYSSYAFQCGAVPSRVTLPNALVKHPHIARVAFDLFEVKFSPDQLGGIEERRGATRDIHTLLVELMHEVVLLADDRALRRLVTLIQSTVRTNYFSTGGRAPSRRSGGVPYMSFKFAGPDLDSITRTGLFCEVWVKSCRMEAVHLRGAPVSRGGIRWSDRPDDFRKEVLGLVRTQLVKNAVIVPAGSKGGFVPLRAVGTAEDVVEEGKAQYRTLIRGMLDLTDNLDAAGEIVHPERVVCFDGPDPYLVVAADKGTARFSDVANGLAAEYDFWLGDAFASGGSHGYDHKAVGITARGAWECVRRHFRERGKDIQSEPFTVVGIGDMGGDVFGNGMLLSRQIRLVAAFDHRHVFIDPEPDAESSWQERARLFALGRSTWDDYDRALLSPGGMIVPRGSKEVELTPEARSALGLADGDPAWMDGEGLIRAVLRTPVELLWSGGIGTYVKASDETHGDAGDPANEAVRVNAEELRCEVVGEGGNLGFTQRARIEYALAGGRINTDALDNSGGVDLSDREVNLKILLGPVVRSGRLRLDERNELLVELTDAVRRLVEADNRAQSLAISLDELRAAEPEHQDDYRDLMTSLEKAGILNRSAEHLPTMETLIERQDRGEGLTRPELCVLLAYAKLSLMDEVLTSGLPDDPAAQTYLHSYFPEAVVSLAGPDALTGHRLRREIVASQLTNDLVDLMGAPFVHRVVRSTGRSAAEVARAWLITARLAHHRDILEYVSRAEGSGPPASEIYRWLLGLGRVLQRTTRWVLRNVRPDAPPADVIADHSEGLALLRARFSDVVSGDDREVYERLVAEMMRLGAREDFARNLVTLRFLDQLLEILRVSRLTRSDPLDAARAFYRISEVLSVPWLRRAIFESARGDRWEQRAANAFSDDLTRAHHALVVQVMQARGERSDVDRVTEDLIISRRREMERFTELLEELRQEPDLTLSGLAVAVREMGALSDRGNGAR